MLLKYKWYKGNEFSQILRTLECREIPNWRLQGVAESRDWLSSTKGLRDLRLRLNLWPFYHLYLSKKLSKH